MIHGGSRNHIDLHRVIADDLEVSVSVASRNGTNWMSLKVEDVDLTTFSPSRDECVAVLRKLRDTIDAAISAEVELVA